MKAIGNNLIIIPDKSAKETKSGLIIPNLAQKKAQTGEIYSLGEKTEFLTKLDKNVMYLQHAGVEIKWKDKTMLILNERDILAVI